MIEVELPDGRILEFPEGTSHDVITGAIQKLLAPAAPTPERTFGQTIYENVIGSGEPDTFGEKLGQYIRGGTAAVARGMADAPALPVNVAQLGAMGVEKLFGMEDPSMVSRALDRLPDTRDMLGAVPVLGPESRYKAPGKVGEFLSTGGEFSGGAGLMSGAKAMLKYGLAPGLASEAAGQATEGTAAEPYARVAAGLFAPLAINTTNKTVNAMFRRAADRPSVETLRDAKNAAYDAVDASGVKIPLTVTDDIYTQAQSAAASRNYVPDVDTQITASLTTLKNQSGKPLTIGQLDKVRQGLAGRYTAAPNQVAILDMIDIVDDAIQALPGGDDLISAARLANSRYKKAELFDRAFQKAADQTASTGSGGNTVNKFRQAVTSIINNPKQSKFFDQSEIDLMRRFVQGDLPENALRLIGKMSPTGNGLMMALHTVGGVASGGATVPLMMAGELARKGSSRLAMQGAEQIKTMAATGQMPQAAAPILRREMLGVLPGLLSQETDSPYKPR
jgi:hypothetical protein